MEQTSAKTGKKTPYAIAVIFLILSLLAATAERGMAETRLTLPEAVLTALESNHELKAQRNSHDAKQADVGIARSFLLPKISLEERYLRTVNPTYAFMTKLNQERIGPADFAPDTLNHPDPVSDFQTALSFEQPIFVKKAIIGLEMSKREVEASQEALQRKKEEIAFKVVQYYLMVGTAAGYVGVAKRALEDAREHQRLAELRYSTGLGLYSDTLRAGTVVAEARQRLVSAEKNRSVAKRALGLMIGSGGAVDITERDAHPAGQGDRRSADAVRSPGGTSSRWSSGGKTPGATSNWPKRAISPSGRGWHVSVERPQQTLWAARATAGR